MRTKSVVSPFARTAFAVLSLTLSVAAETVYVWSGTAADDPLTPGNYKVQDSTTPSEVLPQAGDRVRLAKDSVWKLTDASIGQFKDLVSISAAKNVYDASPSVILDLNNDVAISAAFTYQSSYDDMVQVYKRGTGVLSLTSAKGGVWDDKQGRHGDVSVPWHVEAGKVEFLQTAVAGQTYSLITLEVAKDATAVLFGNGAKTQLQGFSGAGLITNCTGTAKVTLTGTKRSVFSGRIQGKIELTIQNEQWLTGLENTATLSGLQTYGTSYGAGTLGLQLLGTTAGDGASIGGKGTLDLSSAVGTSGRILLLNDTQRTTDRPLEVNGSTTLPATIDAGAHGDYTFTGDWKMATKSMHRLALTGSNVLECVANNAIKDYASGGTNYSFYLSKTGTGIWRLANAENPFSGGIAVENGTLRFDSLAEQGELCALGTATNLYESYTGVKDETAHPPVDYAFTLGGGADATKEGVFAYTGTADVKCSTRPAVITGRARLLNASAKAFDFANVKSIGSTASTLTLDGAGAGNVLRDVSDGDGAAALGIAKEGTGTWTLDGTQAFTGTLDVKAGTLVLRGNQDYTWFKLLIKENYSVVSNLSDKYQANRKVYLSELALYAENGQRQNLSMTVGEHVQVGAYEGTLQPGEVAYGMVTNGYFDAAGGDGVLVNMFDQSRETSLNFNPKKMLNKDDEATWASIVMRLKADALPIKSFDYGGRGLADFQQSPRVYTLYGSVDGKDWHELYVQTDAHLPYLRSDKTGYSYWWNGANLVGASTKKESASPCPLQYTAHESRTVLPDGVKLAVASGSTFTVAGDALTVKELTIDCSANGGTIENVDFATTGTLNLVNAAKGQAANVSFTLTNVTNFDMVSGWTVTRDGEPWSKHRIQIDGSTIRLIPNVRGLILTVR